MPSGEPSMIRLDRGSADFEACFSALVNDRREAGRDVSADVAAILVDVRENGDAAVKALTALFDGFDLDAVGWQIPLDICRAALEGLAPELRLSVVRPDECHSGQGCRRRAACDGYAFTRWSDQSAGSCSRCPFRRG